jgi:hypothetical protein
MIIVETKRMWSGLNLQTCSVNLKLNSMKNKQLLRHAQDGIVLGHIQDDGV